MDTLSRTMYDFFADTLGQDWINWHEAGRSREWGEEVVWIPLGEKLSQSTSELVPYGEYFARREREYLNQAIEQMKK